MNQPSTSLSGNGKNVFEKHIKTIVIAIIMAIIFLMPKQSNAQAITWSNTNSGTAPFLWLTGTNWTGNFVPTGTQIAEFATNPTKSTTISIDLNATTNNGTNNQAVGAVWLPSTNTKNITISNASTTVGGVLTLNSATVNSIQNVIIQNDGPSNLTFQDNGAGLMGLALTNNINNIISSNDGGSGGTITLASVISSVSGSTPLTVTGNNTNKTVAITGTANTFTGTITLTGVETVFSGDGSFGNTANNIIINGGRLTTSFTINPIRNIQVGSTAGTSLSVTKSTTSTFNGVISDYPSAAPGLLVKQGAGILILGGTSTYTGTTVINNGMLQLGKSNALPTTTALSLGQASSTNLGTFDLAGFNQTIAGLTSTTGTNAAVARNLVTTSTGASTLTIGGSGSYTYGDGSLANSGIINGAVSIAVTGGGVQILGDNNNAFTGNITLTNGELRFDPNLTTGTAGSESFTSSAVNFNGGILGTTNINTGSALTFSTLNLQGSSTISKINLGSNAHTITFAASSGQAWGSLIDTVKITGWLGAYNGTTGTNGKIFVGTNASGLSGQQLSQIEFIDGSGNVHTASLLATGELVPNTITTPSLLATGTISFTTQAVSTSSASQSFSLSGANLTPFNGSITITAPSANFTVSTDNINFGSTASISYSGGTFNASNTPNVYVKFTPQSGGNKTGNITATGGGASAPANFAVSGIAQATYKSAQSGNWSNTATWVGGVVPQAAADIVEIQNTHTVTVDATDNNISSLTIDAGAVLSLTNNTNSIKVTNGAATTIVNGTLTIGSSLTAVGLFTSASLEVGNGGLFTNNAGNAVAVSIAAFSVDANGTYNHNAIGSSSTGAATDFPGSASITLDNASTVVLSQWAKAGGKPNALPVIGSWGNLTVNIGNTLSSGNSWGLQGAVTTVHGTLNILSTGGAIFALTKNTAIPVINFDGDVNISGGTIDISNTTSNVYPTVNIAGNLNVSGTGAFHLSEAASPAAIGGETLNITGKLKMSGGSVFFNEAGSGVVGAITVNIGDSLIVSAGTLDLNTAVSDAGAETVTVNLNGNLVVSGTGSIIRSGASASFATVNFTKSSGTQTFASTATGISANKIFWNVGDGITGNALQLNSDFIMSPSSKLTVNSNNSIVCSQDLTIDSSLALLGASTVNLNGHTLSLNLNALLSGANAGGSFTGSSSAGLIIGGTTGGTFNFTEGAQVLKTLVCNGNSIDTIGTHLDITAGSAAGTVTVNTGAVLNTQNNLTIKSDVNGTAQVANSTGFIVGNVTVERYIPANSERAWRLLSVPTAGETINAAWQEGQTGGTNTLPGYGTIISASPSNANFAANGFDFQQQNTSILTYDPANNAWDEIPSTYNPIATKAGYFLYIRGDRSQNPAPTVGSTTPTVLRTQGTLYQGTQSSINVSSGSFNLIGNIYASAIDFNNVIRSGGTDNLFYLWDPKLLNTPPSLGAYVAFSGTNDWVPVPSYAGIGSYGSTPNTRIESGQAFFVHASTSDGTVQLTENSKVAGSADVFRPAAPAGTSGKFNTNLFVSANGQLADGNVEVFNNAYADAVDGNDALKLSNTVENFGIVRNGKVLAIEARQPVVNTDTIYFDMWNMKQQQYKLEFTPDNLNTGLTASLVDTYLNTKTNISLKDVTDINFTVDANAASSASNRFRVIFSAATPVPVTFTSVTAQQQSNGTVTVLWKTASSAGIKQYAVEYSADGNNFSVVGTVTAKAGNATYSFAGATAVAGINYYRIKAIGEAGDITYSNIATISSVATTAAGIAVYPNPVSGSHINIQFNNLAAGTYTARLLTINGQEMYSAPITYTVGSNTQGMDIPATLASGTYQLELSVAGKVPYTTTVIIK